jgi:hypothetical protein
MRFSKRRRHDRKHLLLAPRLHRHQISPDYRVEQKELIVPRPIARPGPRSFIGQLLRFARAARSFAKQLEEGTVPRRTVHDLVPRRRPDSIDVHARPHGKPRIGAASQVPHPDVPTARVPKAAIRQTLAIRRQGRRSQVSQRNGVCDCRPFRSRHTRLITPSPAP